MVSTHPPTSTSSSPFYNPLVTVPKAPITIGIIIIIIIIIVVVIIIIIIIIIHSLELFTSAKADGFSLKSEW